MRISDLPKDILQDYLISFRNYAADSGDPDLAYLADADDMSILEVIDEPIDENEYKDILFEHGRRTMSDMPFDQQILNARAIKQDMMHSPDKADRQRYSNMSQDELIGELGNVPIDEDSYNSIMRGEAKDRALDKLEDGTSLQYIGTPRSTDWYYARVPKNDPHYRSALDRLNEPDANGDLYSVTDVNGDGDTDVIVQDTDKNGHPDTATVIGDTSKEAVQGAEKAVKDLKKSPDAKTDKLTSTGKTENELKSDSTPKGKTISDSRQKRIQRMTTSWGKTASQKKREESVHSKDCSCYSCQKKREKTVSDIRQKNIISALRDRLY